ncbi:hypothetical protein J6590_076701 [Homalodisca vitripennis]|nr:hypothetical protein J6590_076701 [Homalodisca vitripennis]
MKFVRHCVGLRITSLNSSKHCLIIHKRSCFDVYPIEKGYIPRSTIAEPVHILSGDAMAEYIVSFAVSTSTFRRVARKRTGRNTVYIQAGITSAVTLAKLHFPTGGRLEWSGRLAASSYQDTDLSTTAATLLSPHANYSTTPTVRCAYYV